jgi:peptide/nickel transport system permease protein
MLMVGARTSIAVAVVAVGMGMALGVPLGLLAAATRGSLVDEVVMRGNDLIFAFPSLVIAILITAVFGPSAVNAIIAIGIFNTPVFARVTRGAALSLWTLDYIKAARVAGKGTARISVEHILPNVANLLIVQGRSSSASASWPRRRCPTWASARSRRCRPGAGCWLTARR